MSVDLVKHVDRATEDLSYGTRWRLMSVVALPAVALAAAFGVLLGTGVLAATFVAQSGTVELRTAGLQGDQLGITVLTVPTEQADGSTTDGYNVRIGTGAARIDGLCISQHVSVAGVPFTLFLTAGDNDPATDEVQVDGLVLDVIQAKGVIGGSGDLEVNKNGADVTLGTGGIPLGGSSDRFGLQAGSATLKDIDALVRDIEVPGLLTTPDFGVRVVTGTQVCPAP